MIADGDTIFIVHEYISDLLILDFCLYILSELSTWLLFVSITRAFYLIFFCF